MTSPLPPVVGTALDCEGVVYDQAYLLRVIDRSYPLDYIMNIKLAPNGGYELFQAASAVCSRVSLAISRLYCCAFLMSAQGGAFATGSVQLFRATAIAGAINVVAGTVVTTDDGRDFVTTSDADFGALDLGPLTVTVMAIAVGYEYNVPGQRTAGDGELLAGSINAIKRLRTIPNALDPNMQVQQVADASGGQAACLDGLGNDIDIPRQPLETDAAYRVRILETPDTVSLDAIQRGADKVLSAVGSAACIREVGTDLFPGFFFDALSGVYALDFDAETVSLTTAYAPNEKVRQVRSDGAVVEGYVSYLNNAVGGIVGATGAFEASTTPVLGLQSGAHEIPATVTGGLRPEDRFKLLLDIEEFRGFLLVGVPAVLQPSFGLVLDTDSLSAFPVKNAFDTTAAAAPNAAFDGNTLYSSGFYQALFQMIDAKRAGGVGFNLYIEDIGCF